MRKNSLEKLISDLDFLENNFDNLLQEKYDNIMAMILLTIGKSTAYDTGVSRELIKSILQELGRDDLTSELEHVIWEFWKTKDDREKEDVSYSFIKQDGRYIIQIHDYGFSNQNQGVVSNIHPRKDPRVIPNQVDYAIDLMESGLDRDIEKAFNDLESFICKAIDGVLW